MKVLKYIWLFFVVGLLAACTVEDLEPSGSDGKVDGEATTQIVISRNDLLPVNMNGRAAGGINGLLSKVNDLNILLHVNESGGGTAKSYTYIYCKGSAIYVGGKSVGGAAKIYYINGHSVDKMDTNSDVHIHCNDLAAKHVLKVEVIANYGKDLNGTSIDQWNAIKENGEEKLKNDYCMMYGKSTTKVETQHNDPNGALKCKRFDIELKRTRAMLSVKLNGEGLKSGVTITPTKIRLCNVPTQCSVTSSNAIVNIEESLEVSQEHTLNMGSVLQSFHVGEHADASSIPENFLPLYLFENMQGDNNKTNTEARTKYPAGCNSVTDAKNRNKNYKYSYVEIDADYAYRDAATQAVKVSGKIVYRFFLGKDDKYNFDVEGNHYYKLTLNLKGFGGANEDGKVQNGELVVNPSDLSWRVDMDTRDWGFVQDKFDFDAHDIVGTFDVIGDGWVIDAVTGGNGYASWVEFESKASGLGSVQWTNPSEDATAKGYRISENGKLKFHIQPMVYSSGVKNDYLDPEGQFDETTLSKGGIKRTITIRLKRTSTGETQEITFNQYVPIPITVNNETVFMERFEEFEGDGFEWGWKGNELSDLKDLNGTNKQYNYGNSVGREKEGLNTTYLQKNNGSSAAYYCYRKGLCGPKKDEGNQGASVEYYALPDEATMQVMLNYQHNEAWGPFEPIYYGSNYWTSSVLNNAKTETRYWNGSSFVSTSDRNQRMRVRAVYARQW